MVLELIQALNKNNPSNTPDFDPDQKVVYYACVLDIPTPRWVVYDMVRYDIDIPEEAELVHQERAYTSPIWYTPE